MSYRCAESRGDKIPHIPCTLVYSCSVVNSHVTMISGSRGGKTSHIPCTLVYSCSVVNSHVTMISGSRGGKTPNIPCTSVYSCSVVNSHATMIYENRGGKTPHIPCGFRSTEMSGYSVPRKPTTNGYRVRQSLIRLSHSVGGGREKHFSV